MHYFPKSVDMRSSQMTLGRTCCYCYSCCPITDRVIDRWDRRQLDSMSAYARYVDRERRANNTVLYSNELVNETFTLYCVSMQHVVEPKEANVCENEEVNVDCVSGTVIMIDRATYIRTGDDQCKTESQLVVCTIDVKPYMERRCAGRRNCKLWDNDELKGWARGVKKCDESRVKTSFLSVTYSCLHGW